MYFIRSLPNFRTEWWLSVGLQKPVRRRCQGEHSVASLKSRCVPLNYASVKGPCIPPIASGMCGKHSTAEGRNAGWYRRDFATEREAYELSLTCREDPLRSRFRRGCLPLQGILLGLVWFLPLR
jgi:hypothetical protein